jgi:hypothetical protein
MAHCKRFTQLHHLLQYFLRAGYSLHRAKRVRLGIHLMLAPRLTLTNDGSISHGGFFALAEFSCTVAHDSTTLNNFNANLLLVSYCRKNNIIRRTVGNACATGWTFSFTCTGLVSHPLTAVHRELNPERISREFPGDANKRLAC